MKKSKLKQSGQGLVLVVIILVIIGGGLWYLYSNKAATDREAREFGRETIKRLTTDHDRQYLETHLGPQAKLDLPPSQRDYMIQRFAQFGVPQQPMQIEEDVTFESYFFEPRAIFIAHLNYPAQPALLQLAISHPVSKWQIDNITFSPGAVPH
jgi:hypothetical protein